ncbi:MAG: MFS transporter [Aeromicrobium sp.]
MTATAERETNGSASPEVRTLAVLAIILTGYFMILLDNSVIFTGLPSIEAGMDLSDTGLSWVQDAYTLVFGGLLLLGARAGDIIGRRRLFIIGLAIFSIASFLIGVAPTGWWLIGSRALQGVGAAIVAPTSLSLITSYFPEGRERTRAVAWYGATAGVGASLGLVVGGALADWISWRAGFFVNVPIGIAMVFAALAILPETERRRGRFDVSGAILATGGMGALVYGIISSADHGWADARTLAGVILGVVLLAALVVAECRAEQPIMPLRLFRSRARSGAYAVRLLYLGAMIGFFYFITQYLQGVLGWSPLEAGLGFLPMTVVNFAVALAIPRLGVRVSNGVLVAAGVVLTLAGMVWLSGLGAEDAYLSAVALPMLLVGMGQGLAFAPLTSLGVSGVTASDAGAASGLVNTAHQLGMALGLSVLVTVSTHARTSGGARDALAARVSTALTGGAVLLLLALVVSVVVLVPAIRSTKKVSPRTSSRSW